MWIQRGAGLYRAGDPCRAGFLLCKSGVATVDGGGVQILIVATLHSEEFFVGSKLIPLCRSTSWLQGVVEGVVRGGLPFLEVSLTNTRPPRDVRVRPKAGGSS